MFIEIRFDDPFLPREQIPGLQTKDLDDFYVAASETDRLNLFFVLLNTLHRAEDDGEKKEAAHLSFLTAYYLFVPLTPPGSAELALHYIRKAAALDPRLEYGEWLERIQGAIQC